MHAETRLVTVVVVVGAPSHHTVAPQKELVFSLSTVNTVAFYNGLQSLMTTKRTWR